MKHQLELLAEEIPQYSIRLVRERMVDGPLILAPMSATQAAVEKYSWHSSLRRVGG